MNIFKNMTWGEKLASFCVLVIIILVVASYWSNRKTFATEDTVSSQSTSTVVSQEELDEVDAKKLELYKRRLIAEDKKETEDAAHSAKMKLIEQELEKIRSEELQVGGSKGFPSPVSPSK